MYEMNSGITEKQMSPEALQLYTEHRLEICKRTDRMFAVLMAVQWVFMVFAAAVISPLTWIGTQSHLHPHVWAAFFLGGMVSLPPIALAIVQPGQKITRYVISVCQMLTSALLIHLTGGRIETHFHVFGSLAFLAFYREWPVLIPAAAVVALDHMLRGLFFPQSVYGVIAASPWRWVEHAGWVIFEEIFLIMSCLRSEIEMREIAQRAADLGTARENAESANRAKSQFLANMSHEIRTPLNGVIGMADLLARKGELNEKQQRYVSVIKSSADALLSLINGILDFSKIEAGKLELNSSEFDLGMTVEGVVELLAERAAAKNLHFTCRIASDVPAIVKGDQDRLRQVLINLANNAIKFTESGSVIIWVQRQDSSSSVLRFAIRDTGIGIPADKIDRLFKSFSQVDSSNTRKYGGTGLGLAISKQLIELMGGSVHVESAAGKGSTFTFTIPLPAAEHPTERSGISSSQLRGARVLLLDHHENQRQILREHLESWGLITDVAGNCDDALSIINAASAPYELGIINLKTARDQVTKIAGRIKAQSHTTALLAVSELDDGLSHADIHAAGFSASLSSPIRPSQLFDGLVTALASARNDAEFPHQRDLLEGKSIDEDKILAELKPMNLRVLVAEDNQVNQDLAREILNDAGCKVSLVGTGRAALEAAVSGNFDLILMDCQMPDMDGFESTHEIRFAEKTSGKHVPIIALTANAIQGDRERCLRAGMDAYVTKPVDPDQLYKTMLSLLVSKTSEVLATGSRPIGEVLPSPLDIAALLTRCRGKATLARSLLTMFQSNVQSQLAEIRAARECQDGTKFCRLAHTLKGTSANLSMTFVSRVALDLEKLGESPDWAAADGLTSNLLTEVDRALAAIPAALEQIEKTNDKKELAACAS